MKLEQIFNKTFFVLYSLLFVVTPLVMFDKTSELFEFNKLLFIYFAALTVGCMWILKMILTNRLILKRTVLDIPILLFLLSQAVSTVFSIDMNTSIFGYYGRFNGGLLSVVAFIIIYYGFVTFIAKKYISKFIYLAIFGAVLVFLWGLPARFGHDLTCLIFSGQFTNSCWTSQFRPAERMFSTLGQPNWLGAYFVISFFLSIYVAFVHLKNTKNIIVSLLLSSLPVIFFLGVLFTKSRSAFLALGLSLFIFLADVIIMTGKYKSYKEYVKKYKNSILIVGAALVISVLIFKTGVAGIDKYITFTHAVQPTEKINSLTEAPTNITESFDIRKIVWKGAVDLAFQYPLFGTGVETFGYSYNFVRPVEHNMTSEWDYIYNKAHNEYLNYAATTGFFGLISYMSLLITFMIWFCLVYRRNSKLFSKNSKVSIEEIFYDNMLYITCFLAWLTILVTNFFGFSTTITNIFFYLIPACLFVYINNTEEHYTDSKILSMTDYVKLTILAILYLYGIWYLISYFRADINYSAGNSLLQAQDYGNGYQYVLKAETLKKTPVYEDKLSTALSSLALVNAYQNVDDKKLMQEQFSTASQLSEYYSKRAIDASPENPYFYRSSAKNYYVFYTLSSDPKMLAKGINAIHQAEKYAPTDPKNFYTEGLFYLMAYDTNNKDTTLPSKIENTLNEAIKLKPDYRDVHFALGSFYKKIGNREKARAEFGTVLKIVPQDQDAKKELMSM